MALLEQLCWAKGFYRLHMCRPDLLQLQAIEECCPIYMLTFVLLLRPPSCIDQQSPERTGRSWKPCRGSLRQRQTQVALPNGSGPGQRFLALPRLQGADLGRSDAICGTAFYCYGLERSAAATSTLHSK